MKVLLILIVLVLGTMSAILIDSAIGVNLYAHYEFSKVMIHDFTYMIWGAATLWAFNK